MDNTRNTRIKIFPVKFPPKQLVSIILAGFMLLALTGIANASGSVSNTTDKFGIKELYPTASGGRQWVSTWDNGISRTWDAVGRDPNDPESLGKGSGTFKVDGQGIMKVTGDPRIYVLDPNYPTSYTTPVPSTVKSWHNVEVTVYGYRVNDTSETYGGIISYARVNHIFQDDQPCDSRGYGTRFRYTGDIDFAKETKHPSGTSTADISYWSGGLPYYKWIGQKFVVYDLPDGNVKLESYIDESDGLNGGNWVKVDEFIDNGANFGVGQPSCNTTLNIDPTLRLTNSDARPGTESGKPNAAIYWKIRNVGTDGLWFKKASVREIDPNASSDPNAVSTDTTPPTVSSTDPANSATNVSITKAIRVTFSESVLSSTNYNSITLKDSYGNLVATTNSLSGSILTISPTNNLTYNTTYTVTIPASAVKDLANDDLASQYTFSFTTSAPAILSTIAVSPLSASEATGNTQQFTAQPKDQFGNPYPATVTWTSSNITVGTVTSTGLFTAITPGVTTITAENGTTTGTASETVINQSSGTVINQSSDPVAYWKFDENTGTTAYDSSGNGNNGTINGATWTAGKVGNALSFDGISDYVDAGNKASLNITNAITIEAWVNPNNISGKSRVIARKSSVYYFEINKNGRLEVYFYGTTNPGYHQMTSTIPLNTWTHVAVTYDGSKVSLYKNDISESFNDTGSLVLNTNHVQIGSSSGGGSRQFSGLIDEVRIYNHALSGAEILADYNADPPAPPAILSWSNNKTNDASLNIVANVSETIQFNATADQSIDTWKWFRDDVDQNNNFDNFTTSFATAGIHTIKVNATNLNGTSSTVTWTVTVQEPAGDPVAYWKFDENTGTTAYDSSGNGNDGTINGATWTAGKINSALLFNGLSNYLDVPDSNSLDITNGITIMAWIKSGSDWGSSSYPRIVDKMGTAESSGYAFMIDKANNRLELSLPAADIYSNANVISLNQWYHVAATVNESSVKFYVNGIDAGTTASNALPTNNTLDLLIGDRSGSPGTRSFNGTIDEVKIYNRALTASEILTDYNAG